MVYHFFPTKNRFCPATKRFDAGGASLKKRTPQNSAAWPDFGSPWFHSAGKKKDCQNASDA
jgi:hypothetical protein